MNALGPVYEAAHGGQSSPSFDFLVGFVVLAMTWVNFARTMKQHPRAIWIAVFITVISGVFIIAGVR